MIGFQRVSLVLLRSAVGWHFLYEGLYKLWAPAWSREGTPLPSWSALGYLRATTSGPLADLFRGLAQSDLLPVIDQVMPIALVLVGLSLLLGAFTRVGGWSALGLLSVFYLSSIPTSGVHQAGAEGAYLFVNKTLVEGVAVLVLLAFDTGRIAGLDLLRERPSPTTAPAEGAAS